MLGFAILSGCASATAAPPAADIVVTGIIPERIDAVSGSVRLIDSEELLRMQPLTIKDVLRRAPGLHVVDEDALGLKLNISVRGLNPQRSGRTLLLEDGAPIQPAPYADPSAHHHTPLERIDRIEFRKGSSQILYGPQSIGGMINFVTRPVPDKTELGATLTGGERRHFGLHLNAGTGNATSGFRVDLLSKRAAGTRDFHRTQVNEIAVKGRAELGGAHALTLKTAYYREDSSVTEGGLTQARYDLEPYANPFRNDRFDLQRLSAQAIHDWQIGAETRMSTQIYYADTARASYRQADTSTDPMTGNSETGCVGEARLDYEGYAGRCGNKMRPRNFEFLGIEPRLQFGHRLFGADQEITIGARAHFEDTNRKRYNGVTPDARERSGGTVLRDDNQIRTSAYAIYGQHIVSLGKVRFTPGLRVERIDTVNTAKVANFVPIDRRAGSIQTLVLPGMGLTWLGLRDLTVFAGVHRGFAPPRPDRDFNPNAPFNAVRPERSLETEVGFRWSSGARAALDLTLFEMRLDDLIVEAPLVGGRSGTFVNAGKALHNGLELSGRIQTERLRLTGTYTNLFNAKFLTDVDESSTGVRGNRVPYAPKQLLDVAIGYDGPDGFGAELGANYVSAQYGNASNTRFASADGTRGILPARTVYRLALSFRPPSAKFKLFATAENLSDEVYISRRVDGLFAGPRRQIVAGITFSQ